MIQLLMKQRFSYLKNYGYFTIYFVVLSQANHFLSRDLCSVSVSKLFSANGNINCPSLHQTIRRELNPFMALTSNKYFKLLFKAAIPDQRDVSQEVIADTMAKCLQQFRKTQDQLNQGRSIVMHVSLS